MLKKKELIAPFFVFKKNLCPIFAKGWQPSPGLLLL